MRKGYEISHEGKLYKVCGIVVTNQGSTIDLIRKGFNSYQSIVCGKLFEISLRAMKDNGGILHAFDKVMQEDWDKSADLTRWKKEVRKIMRKRK